MDATAIALSGFNANTRKLAVAADNIANANTNDFKAKDLKQTSTEGGGVTTKVVERNPATVPVPNNEGGVDQRPNVSLEEEVVNSQIATYSAQANLKVIKAQDKLNKYLLDIQA